jgi:SAM-dependent methyltransferase
MRRADARSSKRPSPLGTAHLAADVAAAAAEGGASVAADGPVYDRIGVSYASTRRPDPRIAAAIVAALGDARSVVNVGAGTGAYEPTDREVVAIEPSPTMIAQRPRGARPAVEARAEQLPLPEDSFDAAMAVNTVQHWSEVEAGLRELRRVARKRVVIFLRNPSSGTRFWLADYLPALDRTEKMAGIVATIERELAPVTAVQVPLPCDCFDGLFSAFWARPEMYLDEEVRRNISNFALAPEDYVAQGLARLEADLCSGEWDRCYGQLRSQPELDLGHRLLVSELEAAA